MRKLFAFCICVFGLGFFAAPGWCDTEDAHFKSSYLRFKLPPNWTCVAQGTEWVCNHKDTKKSLYAVIILTAKDAAPDDELSIYKSYLEKGERAKEVVHVETKTLNKHPWIDGLHLGSEIKSFYTRYLVTRKKELAILLTMSCHKDVYKECAKYFDGILKSVRILDPPKEEFAQPAGDDFILGSGLDLEALPQEALPKPRPWWQDPATMGAIIMVLVSFVVWIFWKIKFKK